MLKKVALTALLALGVGATYASPKDDVIAAAKKLAEADNYTWTSRTEGGGFGGGATEGRIQKDGLTWMSMDMRGDTVEAVAKGDKVLVKTDDGWITPEQASQGDAGGPNVGRVIGRMIQSAKPPAVAAQEWVEKIPELAATEDGFVGSMSEEDAKSMFPMRRGGRGPGGGPGGPQGGGPGAGGPPGGPGGPGGPPPEVKDAKATFTFRVNDGVLSKVVYEISGTMRRGDEEVEVDRTTTIEISNVNSTALDIPAEAAAKLNK